MLNSRCILRATASGGRYVSKLLRYPHTEIRINQFGFESNEYMYITRRSNAQFSIPWSIKEREASTATSNPNPHSKGSKNKWIASAAGVISAVLLYRHYKSSDRKAFALKLEQSPSPSPQRLPGEYNDRFASYTMEEVAKHDNRQNGIWVTYKQGVYDITEFVDRHPGGSSKILMAAGGSIEPFWMIFSNHKHAEIYQLLESMRIGNISKDDAAAATSGMDDPYANEPRRHKLLIVNNKKPFNAEPPASLLAQSFHTPSLVRFFFFKLLQSHNLKMEFNAVLIFSEISSTSGTIFQLRISRRMNTSLRWRPKMRRRGSLSWRTSRNTQSTL